MHHAVVIDASVAVKVVIEEEFTDRARALIADSLRDRRLLIGPPHLVSEVTNAIYRQARDGNITASEAAQALRQFLDLPFLFWWSQELYQRAFDFALPHRLTRVYDSIYAVLAQELNVEFWTDDRRFLEAVGPMAPWIRWIGDYPLEPQTAPN
jgi:predicted nucleic acid-binding protein